MSHIPISCQEPGCPNYRKGLGVLVLSDEEDATNVRERTALGIGDDLIECDQCGTSGTPDLE